MARENIEGVNIVNRTGKTTPEYTKSDVERIYQMAKPRSWQDLVSFIEQRGDSLWHITPGEAVAMKNDFQQLATNNVPFRDNPDQAYEEAHKFRAQNRPAEEQAFKQMRRS